MDLDFKQILQGSIKKERTVEHRFEGDALVIGCMDCGYAPEPGSKECMRCMVDRMAEAGGANRIVLRTGRDLEISGESGQAIKRMASMRRCSTSLTRDKGRCKRCPMHRNRVMDAAWQDFPYPNYLGARSLLDGAGGDEMCVRCTASTMRALAQMESDLEDIRKRLVRP